ncbi:23S rRNA (guanine(745)-N(1))-methyltransferase [Pseudoalteromonas mariniglutinosa]|uniref:23S rRNA (guanine(745)-N(1))-methyltransferase n=1 Tax=Pseudoalteromonas mariniglutinosa TaxID=206042 RepID=UPI00384D318D
MSVAYQCPLCKDPLTLANNSYICQQNHQFDIAKEGYVNLLPVQNKKSKQPGDNLAMVQARRAFLTAGHYHFLQQCIADLVANITPQTVIDLGCGEGFYTQAIANNTSASVYGVDISKPAVKYAAKRYPHCHFSVASISQAPFADHQADVLVSVFAPLFATELTRLAAKGSTLIVATPGPWHLKQLKQIIYNDVKAHTEVAPPEGFIKQHTTLLEQQVALTVEDIKHLIMMTPFAWKFRPEHWQQIQQQQGSQIITLSFYVSQLTKI